MPPWCPVSPYKGLFILVLIFVGLEYLFDTITYTKPTISYNNTQYHLDNPMVLRILANINENHINSVRKIIVDNTTHWNQTSVQPATLKSFTKTTVSSSMIQTQSFEDENVTKTSNTTSALPMCPDDISMNLQGRVPIVLSPVPSTQELEAQFNTLKKGGHWQPEDCRPPKKLAIIIPFRCRGQHLLLFLKHMHPFLQRQQLDYTIYVLEQNHKGPFNRAMLMNVGFVEALKDRDYDCFIFHDIDLLPEDDRNLYTCPQQPRHMSVAVDIFKYKLPYTTIFGGVCAITKEHFMMLNGFSNSFWGWGGEDDDMSNRIRHHHLQISRYPPTIARYTMLTHKKETPSPKRYDVLRQGQKHFDTDGLNTLKYTVAQKRYTLLYTWILVNLDKPS